MRRLLLALPLLLLFCTITNAQAPILFFSDLISGPASGNSDTTYSATGGVYVTLYGNFLDNFTSVKLNGASCLTVVSNPTAWRWYERMIVKLGTTCTSGNFSITTANGTWSGPTVETTNSVILGSGRTVDFTVSAGGIFYVATTGNDAAAGTFSAPWLHPYFAVQTEGASGAGNVIYLKAGSYGQTEDGQGWGASITMRPAWSNATATSPDALVAYPGTTVQVGCETSSCPGFSLRMTDTDSWIATNKGYWTFAGILWRSNDNGSPLGSISGGASPNDARGWRLVANDVSSPTAGDSAATPFQLQLCSHSAVLGNWVHDVVLLATSRLDQAMYLSTDANNIEVGWNEIYNNKGRGGLQTHSSNLCYPSCVGDTTGFILHDLLIHDNMIHHINEEGILIDTVDPSQGAGIRVYNNVVYDAGLDGSGDTIHFQLSGDFTQDNNTGHSPAPLWWYNNTVSCSNGNGCWGAWFPDIHPPTETSTNRLGNNILYSTNSTIYLDPETYFGAGCGNTDNTTACPSGSGNKNTLYGNGTPTYPNLFLNSLNSNPLFVSPSTFNFHLQSGSSAIGAGLQTIQDVTATKSVAAPIYDIDGRIRPSPPSVGAYEFTFAAVASGIFYAQAAVGSGTGADCADAKALPIASGDWAPGNTIHLCGTITFPVGTTGIPIVGRNGTSSNPITVLAEPGLVLQSPKFSGCADGPAPPGSVASEGGAIDISSTSSFIILDGGTNGIIQNTANGTTLANQGCSLGIWTSGDNIIVRNWTIQNIYNRVSGTTTGAGGSTGDLFVSGGATSIKVCNNTLNNASIGAELNFHTTPLTPGITSWTNPASCQSNTFTPGAIFGNNTMDDHNWMSHVNGIGAPVIINNTFGPIGWSNWNNDNNDFHSDGYFVEGNSAASFKPYFITNYMSGAQAFPSGMFLFTDNGAASSGEGQQAVLVGNVMYGTGAAVTCCQGIGIQAVVTGNPKGPYQWYNNTTINFGFSVENYAWQVASPTIDVRNNIYMIPVTSSAGWFFHNEGTGWSFSTATINGNNYFGGRSFPPNGPFGLWTSNVLYPAWKTNCVAASPPGALCDTNSAFADPLLAGESSFASGSALTPSGFIPAANSAAANLGDNLASQCASIPNQCAGMPQTVGAGGSCGIGCIARPASGRWTAGAFQLTSGSVAPNPPTGLAATVSASTVSLSWTASTGTPAPTAYTMYRGTVHGGPYTAITSGLTTTSTTDTPASGTYFYVIAAYIGGIVSNISGNGTTATVTCTAACAFPTGAVFTIGGDSQAAFNGTFTSTGQPTGSTFTFASSTNASGTGGGAWQSGAESTKSNEVTVTTPATLTASFLHASLVFANQTVGTSSASQSNPFTNTSAPGGTITISGKSITGANASDFSFTDNCPSLLLSSVSCNFNVTFTPTAPGARVATLTVTDNASGSPQTSALSGTGVAQTPIVTLNPTSLAFGDQALSTTSSVRSIILTNTGSGTLNITSVVASGDFAVVTVPVTNCGGTLAPLATCSLNVTFTPTATGGRVGAVTVTDNAAGSPHVANLSGNGITTKCAITGNVTLSGFGSVCQ